MSPKAQRSNRLINTVVTLGSILIGLGILLFVASNWDKLSRPIKLTIIFSVITGFNFAGYYFTRVKNDFPGLGHGFLLVGAFAFGAGIWLIAQIYHIHYNFSAGILFWILGIVPVAFSYLSWMILTFSSVLSCIWLGSYTTYYPFRGAYGFFILAAVLIAMCYLRKQRFSLFVIIVGLTMWLTSFWGSAYFAQFSYHSDKYILAAQVLLVTMYAVFGIILYGLGIWHQRLGKLDVFSFLYKFLAVLFITLSTYSLTFSHHYYKYSTLVPIPAKVIAGLLVLFILAVIILYRLHRSCQDAVQLKEVQFLVALFCLVVIAVPISLGCLRAISLSYNLILIIQILGFIYLGFLRNSEGIFRLAIVIFFLEVLSRYFDIFWKMMPRSLLFIFGGVILIAGAVFANKKRRELEQKMLESNKS